MVRPAPGTARIVGPGILYNTLQGLSAAAALLLLPVLAREVRRPGRGSLEGWGWAYAALGLVLFLTGLHMSLTWPLQNVPAEVVPHCCAADNITFGEPSVFFGAVLLLGGLALVRVESAAGRMGTPSDPLTVLRPLAYVAAFGGLSLFAIALGGAYYGMWTAPAAEPVAGAFKGTIIETAFVTACYVLSGIAAVLAPFVPERRRLAGLAAASAVLAGLGWLAITLSSYVGHIALSS